MSLLRFVTVFARCATCGFINSYGIWTDVEMTRRFCKNCDSPVVIE